VKVVFDTNVVASASFWRGAPFDCLAAWVQGRCVAVVSSSLLAEYHESGLRGGGGSREEPGPCYRN